MSTRVALDRTLPLMRDHLVASDEELLDALLSRRVCIVADRPNLETEVGQQAVISVALLCLRMGFAVEIAAPNVVLKGVHAPLRGSRLMDALIDIGTDLIPEVGVSEGCRDASLAMVFGDTPAPRRLPSIGFSASAWRGQLHSGGAGIRARDEGLPFGALAAAGLAATEAYKAALRRLANRARDRSHFDELFAPTESAAVSLGEGAGLRPDALQGEATFVSGGAIAQASLYALARVRGGAWTVSVVEPEASDTTNLNRYAFLRRSRVGIEKALDLAVLDLGGVGVQPIVARFTAELARRRDFALDDLLVGVDHIPTRWVAQAQKPRWLGVGATSHYGALVSYHRDGLACARCLHPHDDPGDAPIPTVSFVSHWAGLWLAAYFVRYRAGWLTPAEQQVYMATLRAENLSAVWRSPVAIRAGCVLCGSGRAAA